MGWGEVQARLIKIKVTLSDVALGALVVFVLAIEPKVRRLKPD
jgi:hypothetical protein